MDLADVGAVDEFVADVAPADLALERDAQPLVGEVAAAERRDERRGVGQRHEAKPELGDRTASLTRCGFRCTAGTTHYRSPITAPSRRVK